ncbi:hypothetical protein F2Q69_00014849 [Brassica cretica]|uniref:Serine-threonine/tyrosine-protein kinase catalytic domain-containing protein n=1 Tax=Brassica cretica TaxID=69181 RepID=A0A8S9QZ81_BRACR|nr:hypothetical protein F2Q69_00014849 [Brassica cretica]
MSTEELCCGRVESISVREELKGSEGAAVDPPTTSGAEPGERQPGISGSNGGGGFSDLKSYQKGGKNQVDEIERRKQVDFVTLPVGKSCIWIKYEVMGTFGYIDPVYAMTGFVTEYTNVYSFGILMLVLLMGRPATFASSCGVLCNILDYVKHLRARGEPVEFRGNSNDMEPSQMKMFLDLALRCCEERHKDRPKMILYMIFTVKTFILIKKEFDPIYQTSIVTKYSDVYSFEIFMLVLLIGMEPIMDATNHDHIHSYVKYMQKRGEPVELWGDSDNMRPGQMKMFLDLALRCCEKRTEDRPKMITVAKEIKLIEQVSL